MGSYYLSGRGALGARLALETTPLDMSSVATSGAGLAKLLLSLGGTNAVDRLRRPRFSSLLRGEGAAEDRLLKARRLLQSLGVDEEARLADLSAARGPSAPSLRFLCFSIDRLTLKELEGRCLLRELLAGLCSWSPVPLEAEDDFILDAELLFPAEAIGEVLSPPPVFLVKPQAPDAWLDALPSLHQGFRHLLLNDRILARKASIRPVFSMKNCYRLEDFFILGRQESDPGLLLQLAACLLTFFLACQLSCLSRPPLRVVG